MYPRHGAPDRWPRGNTWKGKTMIAMSRPKDVTTEDELPDDRTLDADLTTEPHTRSALVNWLLDDSPYIVMLVLTLIGIVLRLPVGYWVIMAPVFGVISIVAGWRNFETREGRLQLVYTQALSWLALILAIYVLANNSVQTVLSENATSLAMMTLLALGTFVAGLQARVWRICAVGGLLFLAVPGMGWLEHSAVLLVIATLVVIAIGGLIWWVDQQRRATI
jgi:hypothetical protein